MITIREVRPGDIEKVAVLMRDMDVRECRAAGFTPYQGLFTAARQSALAWCGEVDGLPEALFGVTTSSFLLDTGYPWFLGSERARSNARAFLTVAPQYVARIEAMFPHLEGLVHAENRPAILWLRRLGFVVETEIVHSNGEPLHPFRKSRPCALP